MPKSNNNQKIKLLYLMKVFYEKTDQDHRITMDELIESLAAYGVTAERKSIYSDIENLRLYGMDIIGCKEDRKYYYYVGSRQFELAELKLLVDSVQSSRFITAKKSGDLIKKLESLASRYQASSLHRQVYVAGRVKTENEGILYNVDSIHQAIAANRQISFRYFNWNADKKRVFRRNGESYRVSPWALLWSNENYYLVAYDSEEDKIKHFRVDKMLDINMEESLREGQKNFKNFDMGTYTRTVFGMFGGSEEMVTLRCTSDMAGVVIDRFGKNILIRKIDGEYFEAHVSVAVSDQFFGWIAGLGGKIQITGPEKVVESMRTLLKTLNSQYQMRKTKFYKKEK